MSIHSLCKPRPSVFAADRRATVLSLDTFLKGQVNGPEFFEENFFTNGMITLVDRAFRHLGGAGAGSSVFLLSQAIPKPPGSSPDDLEMITLEGKIER